MDQNVQKELQTSGNEQKSVDLVIDSVKLMESANNNGDKAKSNKSFNSDRGCNNKSLKSPFVAQSEIMDKILKHFENPETMESSKSKPDVFFSKRITERLVSTIGKRSKKSIEVANLMSIKNNSNEVNSSKSVTAEESKPNNNPLIRDEKKPTIYALKTYSRNSRPAAQNNVENRCESQKVESSSNATLKNCNVVACVVESETQKTVTQNGNKVAEITDGVEKTTDTNGIRTCTLKSKETNEQKREIVIESLMGRSRAGKRELKNLLQDEGAVDMIYSVNCSQQIGDKASDVIHAVHSNSLTTKTKSAGQAERRLSETPTSKKKRVSKVSKIDEHVVKNEHSDTVSSNKTTVLTTTTANKSADEVVLPPSDAEKSQEVAGCLQIEAFVSNSDLDSALTRINSRFNQHLHKSKIIRTYSDCSDSDFDINDDLEKSSRDLVAVRDLNCSASRVHDSDALNDQVFSVDDKNFQYDSFSVKRFSSFVEIVLKTTIQIVQNGLTSQIMDDLSDCLEKLKVDPECKLVLLTSAGDVFCHGIDFISLIADSKVERLTLATKMATAFERFMNALAEFPKLLIAGIEGSVKGCAVTMLPLFDLVFASDQVTFSTPYNMLACLPENITLFKENMPASIVKELFYCGRELNASEAFSCGLITRKLFHQNFKRDLLLIAKEISGQSLATIETTKSLMNNSTTLRGAFQSELKLLVDFWVSDDCQNRFKSVLVTNKF